MVIGLNLASVLCISFATFLAKYKAFRQNMKVIMMMTIIATLKNKRMSLTTRKVSEFWLP